MLIQALIDAGKLPDRRASRRTPPRKIHGPFHRKMTAFKPRCVTCATKGRETRIPAYRTLCYGCETALILTRITQASADLRNALQSRTIVSMPRRHG